MKNLHLHLRNGFWTSEKDFHVRGHAFETTDLLAPKDIASRCAGEVTFENLSRALRPLSGFFALVYEDERSVLLAADMARSTPLFYAIVGDQVHVGDDPEAMLAAANYPDLDHDAAAEFLVISYVTGPETLYQGIYQIQAGEMVRIDAQPDGTFEIAAHRYYRYRAENALPFPPDENLMERLDALMVQAFERLIAFAGGRTIAVALSGGFDSRLVILMLKRLKYPHVVAYSYGRPNNPESEISRKIAGQLGIRWEFAPYTNESWNEWYHSDEMARFQQISSNLSCIAIFQDWPAVKWLKERGLVPADTVFVSGHSFPSPLMYWDHLGLADKEVPPGKAHPGEHDIGKVIGDIIATEYILFDWSAHARELGPILEERVRRSLGPLDAYPDRTSVFESWLITERQGKFIVNAARVYEFFGFSWWFPLWDQSFRDFWEHVPLVQRYRRHLYETYINRLSHEYFSAPVKTMHAPSPFVTLLRQTILHPYLLGGIEHRIYRFRKQRAMYDTHPLAWYGFVPRGTFQRLAPKVVNILTIQTVEKLEELAKSSPTARSLLKYAPFRLT